MIRMPASTVALAGATLIVVSAVGAYLGYTKATAAPGGEAGSGSATPTLAAKAARPLPEGPAVPVPDETFIRKIAQEEIQSALHPKKPAIAKSDDDNSDNSDDHGPVAAAPSAASVTPMPTTPVTPITPPPPPPPPTGLY